MFNWVIERLRVWGNDIIEDGIVIRKPPGNLIDLKHGKTHYMLMGPVEDQSAPLVVLCHGASVFSFIWKRFAEQFLSRGFRVLVFDFYGHGYTTVPNVKFTNELLREQLEELLDRLGLRPQLIVPIGSVNDQLPPYQEVNDQTPMEEIENKPQKYRKTSHELYLVGHSMGGLIASEFAAKNKELVTKIILFNSAGLPVDLTIANYLPFAIHQLIRFMRTHNCWINQLTLWEDFCSGLQRR
jgi:pimeloyl-ACP methyl ester carboxylesterase